MLSRIIQNLLYDIAAIRRYGFTRHLRYLFDYTHCIVNLHFHLDYVPRPVEPPGIELLEIDLDDTQMLKIWTSIINEAFGFPTPYCTETVRAYIREHPYKNITNLFLVSKDMTPVATFFIGTFRENPRVGCAGRFAVRKSHQKTGLGLYLVHTAMDRLRSKGVQHYEETFNYKRDYSIRLFIRAGGFPEFRRRFLQLQPTRKCFLVTWYVRCMIRKVYAAHQNELNRKFRLP